MDNNIKIDVIINVYGKPWQTLCTLKSLINCSGNYIDKIFLIEEKSHPYNDNIDFILSKFDNLIHYKQKNYTFLPRMGEKMDFNNSDIRNSFRYQYGIENSNKKYVFITHNDILYTGDIIGNMLNNITDEIGIGLIGQCWNCPAFMSNKCNSDNFYNFNPTYEEIMEISEKYKPTRQEQFIRMINKNNPMPLPECRLNEFACLIDREVTIRETPPNGSSHYFGEYTGIDLASAWFSDMFNKGYKFKNFDIDKFYNYDSGYQTQLDKNKYEQSEKIAKQYYLEHFLN